MQPHAVHPDTPAPTRALAWGILGTGKIAGTFARQLPASQSGKLLAVASRSLESAARFAADYTVPRAYDSYDALLADPEVDAVYISLPNHLHARWTVRCAEAGKHILCEKPLAANYAEAMTAVEAARAHGVFLMEAFMYRCHPQTAKLVELVRSRAIGDVRLIQANFSYNMPDDLTNIRLQNQSAGGSIMDVGCYCMSMARLIAGAAAGQAFANPVIVSDGYSSQLEIKGYAHLGAESGVDEWATATVKFPGDLFANLVCGLHLRTESSVRIWGSAGHLVVPNPWFPGDERFGGDAGAVIEMHRQGAEPEAVNAPGGAPLYAIEADTVARGIDQQQAAPPAMTWADSLGNMRALGA